MSEFTTIQIRKDTKTKLDLMKAENKNSYDVLIQNLLAQAGGAYVDDIITVNRDKVAMSLKYWEDDNDNVKIHDITFEDLRVQPVGTVFTANANPVGRNYVNCVAEIVAKRGADVILLVKEFGAVDGVIDVVSSVVHVNLF